MKYGGGGGGGGGGDIFEPSISFPIRMSANLFIRISFVLLSSRSMSETKGWKSSSHGSLDADILREITVLPVQSFYVPL